MSDENPSPGSIEKPQDKKDQDSEQPSPLEPEVLKNLPPDVRKAVEFSLQAFSTPIFHPITKKINEGHIDKLLDQSEKDSEREFKDRFRSRIFALLYGLMAAALFVFVTIYLAGEDKELYRDILTKIIIFFGGAGAGYGFKAYRDRE